MKTEIRRLKFQALHRNLFAEGDATSGVFMPDGWVPLGPPEVVRVDNNGIATLCAWAWREHA